jgi:transposase InsO family protein
MMYAVLSTIEPDRSQAHAPAWAGAGGMGLPLSPCPERATWSGYPPANTRQLDTRQCQYEPLPEQYTSIAFTERLAAGGVSGSVGTFGDAYDNALAESVIGLFKTELIKPRGPWRTAEQVELATLEYVDWFNHRRLYEACGDIPPAELEDAYYRQNNCLTEAALSET